MNIPDNLTILIHEANESIIKNPNGELILGFRKKIWSEFGEVQGNGIPSQGTKRRTMLEIMNIERVINLWYKVRPNDKRPNMILENIKNYFNGVISRDDLKMLYHSSDKFDSIDKSIYNPYDLWTACENYIFEDSDNQKNYMVGFCVCKIKSLAINDTNLSNLDKMDLDYDSYDTHVSFDISCIEAPYPWANESESSILRRRNYWTWYINEAVPKAYNSY